MYDRFDSPVAGEEDSGSYDGSPLEKAGELSGDIVEKVRENWKTFVIAVLALLVLFFAYDFFLGSVRDVSFNLADTEGKAIQGAVRIQTEDGQEIRIVNSGEKTGLRVGTYRIDVTSTGYKPDRGASVAIVDSKAIDWVLEADKDLELEGEFPDSFVSGEEKTIAVAITNGSENAEETELVLDGDAKSALELEYEKPIIANPGVTHIQLKIIAKKNVETRQTGVEKKGVLRISGLNNEKAVISGRYSLTKFEDSKLKAMFGGSKARVDYGRVKAGSTVEKTLKISNENAFDILDMKAEVKIISVKFSDPAEVESWFAFSPENTLAVAPNSEAQLNVILNVPSGISFPPGTDTEPIIGALYVKTSFFERKFDISFDTQKVATGISISGISEINTVRKTGDAYLPQIGFIEIRNTGDVLLTNFDVKVDCSSAGSPWLSLENNSLEYQFVSLEKGQKQQVPYSIVIPPETPAAQSATCRLGVSYNDPANQTQQEEKALIIATG